METENIKISIIVPVYNVEKYIKRCMDSLVNQSFESYEIIVVNDGTLDNSMVYVARLQERYDNIVVVERSNGGLSAARNSGIERARGEYILFVDSDDSLENNCLGLLYQEAWQDNLDLLLFDTKNLKQVDEQWLVVGKNRENLGDQVTTGAQMYVKLVTEDKFDASACLYMMRRSLLLQNSLRFYDGIIHEDELFTPILLIMSERVKHKNWLLYDRYEREGSIMFSDNLPEKANGLFVVICELDKWRSKQVFDEEVTMALEKEIKQHIQRLLGYYALIPKLSNFHKKQKEQVNEIVKVNRWSFGLLFKLYLIKQKMKTIVFDICKKGNGV